MFFHDRLNLLQGILLFLPWAIEIVKTIVFQSFGLWLFILQSGLVDLAIFGRYTASSNEQTIQKFVFFVKLNLTVRRGQTKYGI